MDTPAARHAELAALLDRAAAGSVPLAVLGDDAEHVLGGGRWALSSTAGWTAWVELPAAQRQARAVAALAELVDNGALRRWRWGPDGLDLDRSPGLALVSAARVNPGFVGFGAGVGADHAVAAPRCFGVSDQLHGWQGVVVELVHEGRHHYRLLTPGSAARSLARWLAEAVTGDRLGPPAPQACLVVLQRGRTAVDARAVGATMGAAGLDVRAADFDGRRVQARGRSVDELAEVVFDLLRSADATSRGAGR